MYKKLSTFLILLCLCVTSFANQSWDVAVAVKTQIELFTSNGTYVGSAAQDFNDLKALAFDPVRHHFLVSDMLSYEGNTMDSIYNIHLNKELDIIPIIKDLSDDILGITIDPITDTLYWTDALQKTISYVSLKSKSDKPEVFMKFDKSAPKDITIDPCNRYLYWTTYDFRNSSIERASLETKQREILVDDDLGSPAGITMDLKANKIYWLDERPSIYFRIETTDLTGKNRKILFEGTNQSPYGIAIDNEYIYWTDTLNQVLWRKKKDSLEEPENVKKFEEKPRGIAIQNAAFSCAKPVEEELKESVNITTTTESVTVPVNVHVPYCLNNGQLTATGCKCPRGFSGYKCEISLCYNYCLNGECTYSSGGLPMCRCAPGYIGNRCEQNVCDAFCLNGGTCQMSENWKSGICSCPEGFFGTRCEKRDDLKDLCRIICLTNNKTNSQCRCEENASLLENNITSQALKSEENIWDNRLKDPFFLALMAICSSAIMSLAALSVLVCKLSRRPRIKKRIVVNKNITPLTYRPQQSGEQCEITIENCCNMNVCETPCFEPSQLRGFSTSKKEEKKNLLSNMENNGEDLY